MRVRLDQVREQILTWTEEVPIAVDDLGVEGVIDLGPVACSGELELARPGFLLRARLRYHHTLSCFRCLEPTKQEADYDFQLLLLTGQRVEEPIEQELDNGDLDVLRIRSEELDTVPLLFEQVQLNVPMKPLCSESCQGLCVVCGVNRNVGSCDCETETVDSRWAALAALKGKLPDSTN